MPDFPRDKFDRAIDSSAAAKRMRKAKGCQMRQSKIAFTITLMLQSFMSNAASASTVGFQPPVSYPTGPVPVAVATGDFDGDGNRDLVVANVGDPSAGDDGYVSLF